jgi:exopolyphosphatase/guanosine-5'-triphosphate,3'-diphosphate pyrophosphatase
LAKGSPALLAAIDIGSTSARLEIAQTGPDGTLQPLEHLVHPVSLGVDTFRLGYVTPATTRAACLVLRNFARVLKQYQVTHYRAVTTSAIREATNKDIVVDRIRHESGLQVEILDAVGEMRLTFATLRPFLKTYLARSRAYTLVLDLGGGSTEMVLLHGADLVLVGTRRLGTARLFQSIISSDCDDAEALLESQVRNLVDSAQHLFRAYPVTECVVINPVLARALRNAKEARALKGGLVAGVGAVRRLGREAHGLSLNQARQRFGLQQAPAELLLPAALAVNRFLDHIRARRVWFPEVDLLSGLLHDQSRRLAGADEEADTRDQVVRSTLSIATKYHCDEAHARQVARLAVQLFDGLASFLDLAARDRLLLEVAALLHDIGNFVSERAHHKHSAYLIRSAEIVGLRDEDLEIISQVARYHRKRHPAPQHVEFAALPVETRLRISKLAALLRIADALDRGHRQLVRRLEVRLQPDALRLHVEAREEPVVEAAALRFKGRLFEELTGMAVRLQRVRS